MTRKGLFSGGAFLGVLAAYQLLTKGVTGPFTAVLLYGTLALGIGCCVASEIMAFRDRLRQRSDDPTARDQPKGSSEVEARPAWAGDRDGNRRRLIVILVVFAVLGLLAVGFVLMQ
jgi:hypothetical protein